MGWVPVNFHATKKLLLIISHDLLGMELNYCFPWEFKGLVLERRDPWEFELTALKEEKSPLPTTYIPLPLF